MFFSQQIPSKRLRWVFLTLFLLYALTGIETTLVIPSLSKIRGAFQLTDAEVNQLFSINFIGYCISCVVFGALGDRLGTRPVVLLGLMMYIGGCGLCIVSDSYGHLLLGRLVQGMGIAATTSLAYVIISDCYTRSVQVSILSLCNGGLACAMASAPFLGTYLIHHYTWHSNFWALLVAALAILVLAVLFIPQRKNTLRVPGTAGQTVMAFFRLRTLVSVVVAILMLEPYLVFSALAPLFYTRYLNVSLDMYNTYQAFLTLFFAAVSFLGVPLIATFGRRKIFYASLYGVVCFVACVFFFGAQNTQNPMVITGLMAFYALIIAPPLAIFYPIALESVPQAKGQLSSFIVAGRYIVAATSVQMISTRYQGEFQLIAYYFGIVMLLMLLGISILRAKRHLSF